MGRRVLLQMPLSLSVTSSPSGTTVREQAASDATSDRRGVRAEILNKLGLICDLIQNEVLELRRSNLFLAPTHKQRI